MFFLQLLCLIGEAFGEDSDQVCGAVVNIRAKGDKLAVWTQFADKSESVLHIGYVQMVFNKHSSLDHVEAALYYL